jgi:hypothetical protein
LTVTDTGRHPRTRPRTHLQPSRATRRCPRPRHRRSWSWPVHRPRPGPRPPRDPFCLPTKHGARFQLTLPTTDSNHPTPSTDTPRECACSRYGFRPVATLAVVSARSVETERSVIMTWRGCG